MARSQQAFPWLVALLLLLALPATAEVFTVKLVNGTSFESRYRPEIAGWDESRVVVITGVGTRISLPMDLIDEIVADSELRGFGTVIDTTTIALGWAPNDAATPSEEELGASERLLNYLQQQQQQRTDYSVEQFVNVEEAGMGGLPSWSFTPSSAEAAVMPVGRPPG